MKTTYATLAAIGITMCTALAGCGTDTTEDLQAATRAECTAAILADGKPGTKVTSQECEITLKDTRKLDCVIVGRGLSCDWNYVSGADKEPDR